MLTRWSASRRHFLLEWSWACCRPRADLTPWPDEKHRCGAHPAAGCQMKRTTGALPGWGLRSTGGRPSLLRSRLAVVTLSVIAAVAALTMSALPAAASRPRASAAASAVPDVAATTLTTYAGGSAVTPPQPCTSTVDFDGQEPVGPGSWCLLSWTVGLTLPGPYKPTGGGTLGDYVAHLSATAPTSVTIAVPDGGLFMGSGACEALAPGAYSSGTSLEPCLATYTSTEDVASKERAEASALEGGSSKGFRAATERPITPPVARSSSALWRPMTHRSSLGTFRPSATTTGT